MDEPPYYPLSLNLHGCRVLVAGGGNVATRKVKRLLESGARVLLVSPEATETLKQLLESGDLEWQKREAVAADVAGCTLVFAATNQRGANEAIANAAREAGIPVNRADAPKGCDFFVPALLRRGDLTVAITTQGKTPALAKWVRRLLDANLAQDLDLVSRWFVFIRREVIKGGFPQPVRAKVMSDILDSPAPELAADGRFGDAWVYVKAIMEDYKEG